MKLGARYYDPAIGRFTQPDPSGAETNMYAYADANPINSSDPGGTISSGAAVLGGLEVGLGILGLVGIFTAEIEIVLASVVAAPETAGLSFVLALAASVEAAVGAGLLTLLVADGLERLQKGKGYLF